MNIIDSVRRTARMYPGGIEAVALRLGKAYSTLVKELSGAAGYKLGADDAAEIVALAVEVGSEGAVDYPNAVAERVGGCVVLLPQCDAQPSGHITALDVAALMRNCADVASKVALAEQDGRITRNEVRELQEAWAVLVRDGQSLLRTMQHKHLAGLPLALRGEQ